MSGICLKYVKEIPEEDLKFARDIPKKLQQQGYMAERNPKISL